MMSQAVPREAGRPCHSLRLPGSLHLSEEPRLESARRLENSVSKGRVKGLRVLLAGTRIGFVAGPGRRTFIGGIR